MNLVGQPLEQVPEYQRRIGAGELTLRGAPIGAGQRLPGRGGASHAGLSRATAFAAGGTRARPVCGQLLGNPLYRILQNRESARVGTSFSIDPGTIGLSSKHLGSMSMRTLFSVLAAIMVATSSMHAAAAEIRVLTAGAYKPIVLALAPAFEKQTGHKLLVTNDTAGGLERRIGQGEAFDVVVMPPAGLERLVKAARVAADSPVPLARVAIGVAVKRGAPMPDIATVASFQRALLAARAVAYIDPAAGGSSGIYLSQLFERWGLAAQIRAKAVLVPGGLVAERLVNGEADLALHQVSEILAVPGAQLVGPIPTEIQNYTAYSGAVSASAADPVAARALLSALRADSAREVLKDKGMEAP